MKEVTNIYRSLGEMIKILDQFSNDMQKIDKKITLDSVEKIQENRSFGKNEGTEKLQTQSSRTNANSYA